ncbi:MAG: dienelactone hydrolase family protein [Chloroflexi bacterium]|nr:dienelactone hydrolase family protein [Chloroflexota bacterium]
MRISLNEEMDIVIPAGNVSLYGDLYVPEGSTGIVLFAHGSGSSRKSPRNRHVAGILQQKTLATLLFDLLTIEEEAQDLIRGHLRFNIKFLTDRLVDTTDWMLSNDELKNYKIGYFGASTGAAAALVAASLRPDAIHAVVSRGGRPDLAKEALAKVKAPTLLVVGGHDYPVITMNREALAQVRAEKELVIVPGATHLFEEPGAMDEVAQLAANWFDRHLK